MTLPYLEIALAFIVGVDALSAVVDVRQLRALQRPRPPPSVAKLFPPAKYAAIQAYSLDKWCFGMTSGLFSLAKTVVTLWFGVLPALWDVTGRLLPPAARGSEIWHTIAFVLLMSAIDMAFSLPWSIISTFYVEQKHGFNKQTPLLFVVDLVKGIAIGLVLLPPIVGGLTYILQHAGPYMPLYLWAFVLVLSLALMALYPTLIAPLFNKFTPLPDGSLRASIEALAAGLRFPLKKLFQVDGSTRSAHSNAYMYGFGSHKRIVLYDTLVEQCSEDQVVAVLAHELGHWKLRHTPINLAMAQVIIASQFALFAALRSDSLAESFGFRGAAKPAFVQLLLFQYLMGPVDEVVSFLTNLVSRTFEYQADRFAVDMGKGDDLKAALIVLQEENKSSPNVDPVYSAFNHTHPPLVLRLAAIEDALKKPL